MKARTMPDELRFALRERVREREERLGLAAEPRPFPVKCTCAGSLHVTETHLRFTGPHIPLQDIVQIERGEGNVVFVTDEHGGKYEFDCKERLSDLSGVREAVHRAHMGAVGPEGDAAINQFLRSNFSKADAAELSSTFPPFDDDKGDFEAACFTVENVSLKDTIALMCSEGSEVEQYASKRMNFSNLVFSPWKRSHCGAYMERVVTYTRRGILDGKVRQEQKLAVVSSGAARLDTISSIQVAGIVKSNLIVRTSLSGTDTDEGTLLHCWGRVVWTSAPGIMARVGRAESEARCGVKTYMRHLQTAITAAWSRQSQDGPASAKSTTSSARKKEKPRKNLITSTLEIGERVRKKSMASPTEQSAPSSPARAAHSAPELPGDSTDPISATRTRTESTERPESATEVKRGFVTLEMWHVAVVSALLLVLVVSCLYLWFNSSTWQAVALVLAHQLRDAHNERHLQGHSLAAARVVENAKCKHALDHARSAREYDAFVVGMGETEDSGSAVAIDDEVRYALE